MGLFLTYVPILNYSFNHPAALYPPFSVLFLWVANPLCRPQLGTVCQPNNGVQNPRPSAPLPRNDWMGWTRL